jgi:GxxExxY protein
MKFDDDLKAKANDLSKQVIGAAIEVHRHLGPGLLESSYEICLARELELRGIPVQRQVYMPIEYKGIRIEKAYRIDMLVSDCLVIEVKSLARIEPIHEAQLLTYLRLSESWLGLILNFHVPVLKDGIKRLVLG